MEDRLQAAAQVLLDAAIEYWEEYRRATGGAAVVWVTDTEGRMIVLTRGEYRETLMQNIHVLKSSGGKIRMFDSGGGETE